MRHPRTRRYAAGLAAGLAASTLLAAAPPATAALDDGLDDGLHSLTHVDATGRIGARDGVIRAGCQAHRYRYRVRPADTDWSLELFLADRRGREVASGYEWRGADPARGRGRLRFCSRAVRPGRFTLRARLTWDDGRYHERWLTPRHFRLRRR